MTAYMKEHGIKPECVIMLTDGIFFGHDASKWSEVTAPVLWCVVGNESFTPVIGQTVCVE